MKILVFWKKKLKPSKYHGPQVVELKQHLCREDQKSKDPGNLLIGEVQAMKVMFNADKWRKLLPHQCRREENMDSAPIDKYHHSGKELNLLAKTWRSWDIVKSVKKEKLKPWTESLTSTKQSIVSVVKQRCCRQQLCHRFWIEKPHKHQMKCWRSCWATGVLFHPVRISGSNWEPTRPHWRPDKNKRRSVNFHPTF